MPDTAPRQCNKKTDSKGDTASAWLVSTLGNPFMRAGKVKYKAQPDRGLAHSLSGA
ncbi:hypothetical protein HW452_07445 [Halomonas aquamarina]|uniref:Uncharacterized protein n=1 Tax=Vreelandella aquamarina TaxID=77097 RepID=A0ACC5VT87_9GAMM|nr:hypothetical protein [Halomonas aquamarina]MBZ5487358.1 hypothetical protein [Halomonas aquamarina]